jgi:hypothetical protein
MDITRQREERTDDTKIKIGRYIMTQKAEWIEKHRNFGITHSLAVSTWVVKAFIDKGIVGSAPTSPTALGGEA